MVAYYFKPRVGKHYEEGLNGRRTLVLGVHQVCLYPDCPAYGRCTSPDGIRQMDVCLHQPDYELREANSLEMDSFLDPMPQDGFKYPTHSYFTRYMLQAEDSIDEQQKKNFWEHVAFFNFFQQLKACSSNLVTTSGNIRQRFLPSWRCSKNSSRRSSTHGPSRCTTHSPTAKS